jgi:uncharacterized membrane protein
MKQGVRQVTSRGAEACRERRGQQRRQGMEDGVNAGNRGLRSEQLSRGQKILRTVQAATRILLGAFLVLAGTSHLTVARAEFLAQVPTWLPVDGDLVVVLSGIAEIALGLALIFLVKQRVLVGLTAAAFFVLIFPGNISQYVNRIDAFGLNTDQARFTRLFFQPVLVAWALWSTGAWPALFTRKAQSA